MLAGFIAKITGGIWKYVLLIGAGALFVIKMISIGRSQQRGKQAEEDLENVSNRNEALEEVNSLSDAAVDRELHDYIKDRDKS